VPSAVHPVFRGNLSVGRDKKIAVILLATGFTGLAYGGFGYISDVHKAGIGSLHLSLAEKERVNIPVWAGVAFILAGAELLVIPRKTRGMSRLRQRRLKFTAQMAVFPVKEANLTAFYSLVCVNSRFNGIEIIRRD